MRQGHNELGNRRIKVNGINIIKNKELDDKLI